MTSYDYFGGEESDNYSQVLGGNDIGNFVNGFDMTADHVNVAALVHGGLAQILAECQSQIMAGGSDIDDNWSDSGESDEDNNLPEDDNEITSVMSESDDESDYDESDDGDTLPEGGNGHVSVTDFFNAEAPSVTGGNIGVIYN